MLFALARDGLLVRRLGVVTDVGAIRVAIADGPARRWWALALPAGGIAVAGYTLFKHLSPVPPSPYDVFPYVVAAWLAIGPARWQADQ